MRFALYHHVGSGNRGCEALAASTSALLRRTFGEPVRLYSLHPEEDRASRYPDIADIVSVPTDASALQKPLTVADKVRLKILSRQSAYAGDAYFFSKLYNGLPFREDDVFLSIGGDTYCYGENTQMRAMNAELKKLGKTTILWGCSLDESSFTSGNKADLHTYDAIFARDSGTVELLRSNGFETNVFLHPDPAFTLQPEILPFPDGIPEENLVGINASPLVFSFECAGGEGIGMQSYTHLIEYLLRETDCNVLLIPHVFWSFSDDREVLVPLCERYAQSGRVFLLREQYSAAQLKGFISRCRAFVGARTHSTIAAYSSMVPTLVLGYSVKSVNIAHDLFGRTEDLVVPIDALRRPDGLSKAFSSLLADEEAHRAHLRSALPDYVARAAAAGESLQKFLICS